MSEITEVMHKILEFAACTNSAIEIKVETFEGDVQSIKTTIAPAEEENGVDKDKLIKRLDIALDDINMVSNWFKMVGYEKCPAASRLIDIMMNIAGIQHDLEEEA